VCDWTPEFQCHRPTLYRAVAVMVIRATGHVANAKEQVGFEAIFLGVAQNNDRACIDIAPARVEKLRALAAPVLAAAGKWTGKKALETLTHKLGNVALIRPTMRPNLQPLYRALSAGLRTDAEVVQVSEGVEQALRACVMEITTPRPLPLLPVSRAPYGAALLGSLNATFSWTDACRPSVMEAASKFPHGGVGGWFFDPKHEGTVLYFWTEWTAAQAADNDIMVLELWGQLAGRMLVTAQGGKPSRVEFMDNQAVERSVAANRTRSQRSSSLLASMGSDQGLVLRPVGIDTDDNEWADLLSRGDAQEFLDQCEEAGFDATRLMIDPAWLKALEP
jgi:hypothetical protein